MDNQRFDRVPDRRSLIKTPGNRCVLCDRKLQPSANGNWCYAYFDRGPVTRMCCLNCDEDDRSEEQNQSI